MCREKEADVFIRFVISCKLIPDWCNYHPESQKKNAYHIGKRHISFIESTAL